MNHTWGQYSANAYNKDNRDAKRPRTAVRTTTETNVVEIDAPSNGSSTEAATAETNMVAVNNVDEIDMNVGTFECNCIVDQKGESHQLDSLSFTAQQTKIQSEFAYTESFTSLCEEVYEGGLDEITLNMPPNIHTFTPKGNIYSYSRKSTKQPM